MKKMGTIVVEQPEKHGEDSGIIFKKVSRNLR
jgi:hypothetical protein